MDQSTIEPSPLNNFFPIALDVIPPSQDEQLSGPESSSYPLLNERVLHVDELAQTAAFITTLQAVRYGTYDSQPAALIVFQCEFQYSGNNRFVQAIIEFTFSPNTPSMTAMSLYPVIATHEPKHLLTQTVHHSSSRTYQFGWLLGLAQLAQLSGRSGTTTTTEPLTWGTTSSTARPLSRRNPILTRVVYLIEENPAAAKGVPRLFRGAVVVLHREAPFQGRIKVEVKHGGMAGRTQDFLRKGESGPPCLFTPSYPMGNLDDPTMEEMDWREFDLKELVKLPTVDAQRLGESY